MELEGVVWNHRPMFVQARQRRSASLKGVIAASVVMTACAHGGEKVDGRCGGLDGLRGEICEMGEEPLPASPAEDAYRFLWLRSRQGPVFVRVEKLQGGSTLVAAELDLTGKVLRRARRPLESGEWAALQAAVDATSFWNLSTDDELGAADGAMWTLEGKRGGEYHNASQWSPERGPFRVAGEAFLVASRFSFRAAEVY
jgi:hypothetical protein